MERAEVGVVTRHARGSRTYEIYVLRPLRAYDCSLTTRRSPHSATHREMADHGEIGLYERDVIEIVKVDNTKCVETVVILYCEHLVVSIFTIKAVICDLCRYVG